MKNIRRFLKWLSVLLVVAILFFTVVIQTLDPNDYRGAIQSAASNAIGFEVVIDGEMRFKPSLVPTIVVKNARIKNPSWASHPNLAEIGNFELTFDLLSIFNHEIKITKLSMEKLEMLLERSGDGRGNWLVDSQTGSDAGPAFPTIRDISIKDSQLKLLGKDARYFRIDIDQAAINEIGHKSVELEFEGRLQDIPVKAGIQSTQLKEFFEGSPLSLEIVLESGDNQIQFEGVIEHSEPGYVLKGDIALSTKDAAALQSISGLSMPLNGPLEISATINMKNDVIALQQIQAAGKLDYQGYPFSISDGWLTLVPGKNIAMALEGKLVELPLKMNLKGDDRQTIQQEPDSLSQWPMVMVLESPKNRLLISDILPGQLAEGLVNVAIELSGSSLSELSFALGDDLPELGKYNFKTHLSGTDASYKLGNLSGTVNSTGIAGDISIDTGHEPIRVKAGLSVKQLDLAGLLGENDKQKQAKKPFAYLDKEIKLNLPGNMLIDYELKVDRVSGLPVQLIDASFKGDIIQGIFNVRSANIKTPGGQLKGTLNYQASPKKEPVIDLAVSSTRLDLNKLLAKKEFGAIREISSGPTSLKVKAQGDSLKKLLSEGTLSLETRNAKLKYGDGKQQVLQLDSVNVSSIKGKPLQVDLKGNYRDAALKSNIVLDSLLSRLRATTSLPVRIDALLGEAKFHAEGSVNHITNFSGLKLDINLAGQQLRALNNVLDMKLPTDLPYKLSATLKDSKDKYLFQNIKGNVGRSDINGKLDISVHEKNTRPLAVVAWLHSNKIFLE